MDRGDLHYVPGRSYQASTWSDRAVWPSPALAFSAYMMPLWCLPSAGLTMLGGKRRTLHILCIARVMSLVRYAAVLRWRAREANEESSELEAAAESGT